MVSCRVCPSCVASVCCWVGGWVGVCVCVGGGVEERGGREEGCVCGGGGGGADVMHYACVCPYAQAGCNWLKWASASALVPSAGLTSRKPLRL